MSGQYAKEGKQTNGGEGARKSKNNGRRRKKRNNDGTVSRRSDGPFDTVVNGVFLLGIWPEDTEELTPEEWEKVRDYVLNERKKLTEKNGTCDDRNVSQLDSVSTNIVSTEAASKASDAEVKSPTEYTSANTDAKTVTANKSNGSKKKKKGKNGGRDADSEEPVKDSVSLAVDGQQNSSSNNSRAKGKSKSANTSSQNEVSTKQRPAKSGDGIEKLREKSKKYPAKRDSAAIDVDCLSAQLCTEAEQRLAAVQKAKLERRRADGFANQVRSLVQELKRATKALEKSKSEGKRHLTIQKQLLEAHKKELATVNASLCLEQSDVAKLKSQLVLEMAAKESCTNELDRLKNMVASERKKVKDLQEELSHTTTAKISMRQELNENKLRAERMEQCNVVKLKSQLVLEMAAKESCAKELDRLKNMVASERKKVKDLQEELSHTTTAKISMRQELSENKLRSERFEQSDVAKLKSQLVLEMAAKESCTNELDRLKNMVASERKKVKDLQEELSHTTTAKISMRQELSENKLRAERMEQCNVVKLKSQLVLEMAAKESCAKELDKMNDLIASERKKVKDLQDELDHTTTAKNSMEQELCDNELRAERVKKLELELRDERAKIAKLGNNPPKATVTLRKELHETQEKLKNVKKRNAILTSELSQKSYPQRQQQTGYISQRETMGSDGEAPRKTSPKVASPKRATSMPAPVEVSLSERASLVNFESAPVHYDGVVVDNDDDSADESSRVQDELTFIRSAFSSNEISVDDNQVTYTLQLPVDDDSDDVKINISVILPVRYPSVGINDINVALAEASTCCPEIRKIALDALRTVQNICLIEARALEGSAALSTIFSAADMWAKDDWYGVMAKQLSLSKGKGKPSKNSGGKASFEICTFLIYTHHVKDPDKIHFVKKCASKLNLCGYIKIGKPGLILVEGPQSDCEALLEILVSSRKKLRERGGKSSDTAKFSSAGKVVRNAKTSSERVLPKKLEQLEAKDGMDKITDACKKSGLLESLEEVCKR